MCRGQAGEREGASRTPGAWPEPLGQSCRFLGQEVGEAGRPGHRGGRGWEVGRSPGKDQGARGGRKPGTLHIWKLCGERGKEEGAIACVLGWPAVDRSNLRSSGDLGGRGPGALCLLEREKGSGSPPWEAGPSRGWWSGGRRAGSCTAADGGSQAQGGLPAPTPGTRHLPHPHPQHSQQLGLSQPQAQTPSARLSRPGGCVRGHNTLPLVLWPPSGSLTLSWTMRATGVGRGPRRVQPQAHPLQSVLLPTCHVNWDFSWGLWASLCLDTELCSCFAKGSDLACVPPEAGPEIRILILESSSREGKPGTSRRGCLGDREGKGAGMGASLSRRPAMGGSGDSAQHASTSPARGVRTLGHLSPSCHQDVPGRGFSHKH